MHDLRIVFYGTPQFAVASLKALIDAHKNVVAVVTAPDKPAGRGRKLSQSPVKEYALSKNLNILQPTNLKSEAFQQQLEELNLNLQIVVAFRMLPHAVWSLPKYGTFNLHASLLPQYRGAAPINWVLINGETKTGVTTFFIDDQIDTGNLIDQAEVSIAPTDNAGTLHDKLMSVGSELVLKTVNNIANGTIKTQKQPQNKALKTAYKLDPENTKIDWNLAVDQIHNFVRGLSPYPTAWCYFKQENTAIKLKIYKTTPQLLKHNDIPGTVISTKKTIKVATLDGYLFLNEIQLPGKKKMDVQSLLNGFRVKKDAQIY